MNEREIECFIWAARYQNFRRAAQRLYISQPSVTYQIDAFEKEIGFRLFDRRGHNVVLTEAGRYLYAKLVDMVPDLSRVFQDARQMAHDTGRPCISVGWAPVICDRRLVVEVVDAYRRQHPEVDCRIKSTNRALTFGLEGDSTADVVLMLESDVEGLGRVTSFPLFEVDECCFVQEASPLRDRDMVRWVDLADQHILVLPFDSALGSYRRLPDKLREHGLLGNVQAVEVNDDIMVNVAAGNGVTIRPTRPDFMREPYMGLVGIPIEDADRLCVSATYGGDDADGLRRGFCLFAQEHFGGSREKLKGLMV